MINKDILSQYSELAPRFQSSKPFKFLALDGFFETDAAEKLLADFPRFDSDKAIDEFGRKGKKSAHTALKDVSPFYSKVYDYLLSPDFLDAMSSITGIPDLIPDPNMYGGGAHENAHGQSMDPHVDFNYDQDYGYHRRLNLIVYLNKDWDESWGGAIELHSNPRRPEADERVAFNCIFNRAVIFETNEYSWHGFERVTLPETEQHRSRKSLSIYLYTRTRPQEEIVPPHGTFYVPRPLPFELIPGAPLTLEQINEIKAAITHRSNWIENYQKLELKLSGQLSEQGSYIKDILSQVKPVVSGPARPHGYSLGLYADGWVQTEASFSVIGKRPLSTIMIRGWVPDHFPVPFLITVEVSENFASSTVRQPGEFSVNIPITSETTFHEVRVKCDRSFNGAEQKVNGDARDLAFLLVEVECAAIERPEVLGSRS